ncbi:MULTISPECIES: hypothetical protein [Kordiimonas]|jgi:hypothetical protein|uniref:hypothetical protein n=1 Tax=Kordiimonas TaxID=288021 RepID=UPI0025800B8F|nr:hypothetical protein [Kordiimonas sp. UBA4487]
MKNVTRFLFLAVLLSGCMGGDKKDISYLAQRDLGLVVMKIDFKGMVRPELKFRKYDPSTGKAFKETVSVSAPKGSVKSGPYGKMPTGEYFVEATFEPGHWFLEEIVAYSLRGYNARTISYDSYSEGAFGFEVVPAAVHYVGAFDLGRVMTVAEWADLPAGYVSANFSYQASMVQAQPAYFVTFECPREMAIIGRPGCDLGRITRRAGEPIELAVVSWTQSGWVRPVMNHNGQLPIE